KPFTLVINKIDGLNENLVANDFYALGVDTMRQTAASHNRGVMSLIDEAMADFPEQDEDFKPQNGCRIGIIGRPNVGKSTLVNRLLGEERVVVFDQPGTTRDSIYIPYQRHDKP